MQKIIDNINHLMKKNIQIGRKIVQKGSLDAEMIAQVKRLNYNTDEKQIEKRSEHESFKKRICFAHGMGGA